MNYNHYINTTHTYQEYFLYVPLGLQSKKLKISKTYLKEKTEVFNQESSTGGLQLYPRGSANYGLNAKLLFVNQWNITLILS